MKKIILLGLVSILGGCSVAPIQLPNNVSTISASSAGDTYIDKID
ncbi:putative lipoprotein, partial [Acinetobacter sp. 723929]